MYVSFVVLFLQTIPVTVHPSCTSTRRCGRLFYLHIDDVALTDAVGEDETAAIDAVPRAVAV